MKRFIEVISNIWKIDDLKNRILFTLSILLVYRLGSFIRIPGVNLSVEEVDVSSNSLLDLVNIFSGGAFSNASIFALGIMPYISASIVVQLMGMVVPSIQRLQKEGESGKRKLNQITRYLTIVVLVAQAVGYLTYLTVQFPSTPGVTISFPENMTLFSIIAVASLTAGSMFVLWLGERITDRGVGNGISLIIMIGIIAGLPQALGQEFSLKLSEQGKGLILLLVEFVILFLVFMVTILLVQGTRKIPIQYAKRVVGNKQYGGVRQYLPLKVNAAGVMPIIFAQAILQLPILFVTSFNDGVPPAWTNYGSYTYNFILAFLVVIFTYFYTAIIIQPHTIANDLKENGGFIPGVKPGRDTSHFIDSVMSRITLPGSLFLAFVTILPAFASSFGINGAFAQFFGGTSLLILVGVVLDTLQYIESALLMRHYDGLMKTGRIKGRSSGRAAF